MLNIKGFTKYNDVYAKYNKEKYINMVKDIIAVKICKKSQATFIDKYNNIIDEKGNVIKYIQNKDGNYYNSKGQLVDSDGTVLVRNEIGDYVRPEVLIEEQGGIQITGHYDEYGNFIIDKDVLEKYPDAYTIWQEQKNANK